MRKFTVEPKNGMRVYLMRGKKLCWPAEILDASRGTARRIWIDNVGRGHPRNIIVPYRHFTVIKAHDWLGKWGRPRGESFIQDVKWDFLGEEDLPNLTISNLTRRRQEDKMKPPPAQAVWDAKIGPSDWNAVWGAASMYATPRDKTAQFQLKHRNLWVAKAGGCSDPGCKARGCRQEETQEHLYECPEIQQRFWNPIFASMIRMGLAPKPDHRYVILGIQGATGFSGIDREEAGVMQIAWRCLYAQSVKAKLEGGYLNLEEAVYKTLRLTLSRVIAHGNKWRNWYRRQAGHVTPKTFPEEHQKKTLITFDDSARYTVSEKLKREVANSRANLRNEA